MRSVELKDGTRVACVNRHEALVLDEHVSAYFGHGLAVAPGDVVFDVGANIGLFAVRAQQRAGGRARIFAFEPMPPTFEALRHNGERHGSGAIRTFSSALADRRGEADFTFFPGAPSLSTRHREALVDDGDALLQMVRGTLQNPPLGLWYARLVPSRLAFLLKRAMTFGARTYRCELRTVSQMIDELALPRLDLLKIDVEGAELEVLEGIRDGHWRLVRRLVCEVHDRDGRVARVEALLRRHGLNVVAKAAERSLGDAPLTLVFAAR